MEECKRQIKVSDGTETVRKIYKNTVKTIKDIGLDKITKIPIFDSVKSTLYNVRNKAAGVPKFCFTNPQDIVVPQRYLSFLLGDYNCNGVRIILFCSEDMRKIVPTVDHIFGDGTFKSCPPPCKQIYSIHGDINSTETTTNIIPLIYALMSDMSQASYTILFEIIKSQFPSWTPQKFTSDYETATRAAIVEVFPSIITKGCFYHYSNAVWRKAKKLNLVKEKMSRKIVRLTSVLPLLPSTKVREGWTYILEKIEFLKENMEVQSNLDVFVKYIETYWLKDDAFISTWCVFGERHRTTNSVEGWHLNLNNECVKNKKKVTLMQLLKVLFEDSEFNSVKELQIRNKQKVNKRKKDSILNDKIIMDQQMKLINNEICVGQFLLECAI